MRGLGTLLGLLFFAFAGISNVAKAVIADVEISLRDVVRLEGRTFTLGDVAILKGSDTKLTSRLAQVLLGRIPRAGVTAKIEREAITRRIDRLMPGISKKLAWSGSSKTHVQGQYRLFDRQAYLAAAQQQFEDWLKQRYSEYDVKTVGHYEDLQVPDGQVRLQANVAQRDRLSKRMCVWVDLFVDDAHYNTLPVWFSVTAKAEVFEVRQSLSSGTPLTPEMLQSAWRDLTKVSDNPVSDLTMIEGQRLIRDLTKGTVLTDAVLQPVPDVVKGQQLRVRASVGNVTLIAKARALEDGNRGDPIRVERLDGSDSYLARVIDDGLAVVEEEYR
jgi:flagella basal body P-ring formation protein FlgA